MSLNHEQLSDQISFFRSSLSSLKEIYCKLVICKDEFQEIPEITEIKKLNTDIQKYDSIDSNFKEFFTILQTQLSEKLKIKKGDQEMIKNIMEKIETEKRYAEER